jgi:hypothetical protein
MTVTYTAAAVSRTSGSIVSQTFDVGITTNCERNHSHGQFDYLSNTNLIRCHALGGLCCSFDWIHSYVYGPTLYSIHSHLYRIRSNRDTAIG